MRHTRNRIIGHCDMDSYFATVEAKYDRSLKDVPFAVCGDPAMRHGIVLSKNDLAKGYGVITGEPVTHARKKCPILAIIKPDYDKYLKYAKLAREIYYKYTDTVIPYGLDEAWLDFTDTGVTMEEAAQLAELIRIEIMYALDLSASVGTSFNYVFSKIASDHAKPNGTAMFTKDDYKQKVWPLPASDLLFVGGKTRRRLYQMGIFSIGDLAQADPVRISRELGKKGYAIWQFANGNDLDFHPEIDDMNSISHTITMPHDLSDNVDASAVLYVLATAISARLVKHGMKATCVCVATKDNKFNKMTRQRTLPYPTNDVNTIFNTAYTLFEKNYPWSNRLRALSIRVDGLVGTSLEQLSLLDISRPPVIINIDGRVRSLVSRYGTLNVEKTSMSREMMEIM